MTKGLARSGGDIERLVLSHPFAWLVSGVGEDARDTPLPIRPVFGADGALDGLVGHFARSNPHLEALRRDPRALILFMGPNGYVSPSWMADRTQAPTWNYASVQFLVEITLVEEESGILAVLTDLAEDMERDRPDAWRPEEMGERFRGLARGVVGFIARVLETRPGFKLGQDERDDVFEDIMAALAKQGAADLRSWMASFDARSGSRSQCGSI